MESKRLEQLFAFLKDSPGDAFISFAIAKEYEGLELKDKALEYYETLTKSHPDYVGTYYHLGKLYEKLEKFDRAFATYKVGIDVAKKQGDQHALNELAGAKLELGDDDDF